MSTPPAGLSYRDPKRTPLLFLMALFLAGVLPHSIVVTGPVASVAVLLLYGGMGAMIVGMIVHRAMNRSRRLRLTFLTDAPPFALAATGVISVLYLYHVVAGNYLDITNAISAIAAVGILLLNLFVIPRLVSPRWFLRALSRFSAGLIIIAAGMYVAAELSLLASGILWRDSVFIGPVGIPYLTSITNNPNILGRLTFVGVIAAIYEVHRSGTRLTWVLLGINTVGLILTMSQASWIAAVVALMIYGAYIVRGRTGAGRMTALIALGCVMMIAILSWVHLTTGGINLSNRLALWEASVQAISAQPLAGYGHGPSGAVIEPYVGVDDAIGDATHNSYLRMGVIAGVGGLLAYCVLMFGSVLSDYRRGIGNVAIFAIACGFAVNQLFESHMIVGYTSHTIVNALCVGYLLCQTGVSGPSDE